MNTTVVKVGTTALAFFTALSISDYTVTQAFNENSRRPAVAKMNYLTGTTSSDLHARQIQSHIDDNHHIVNDLSGEEYLGITSETGTVIFFDQMDFIPEYGNDIMIRDESIQDTLDVTSSTDTIHFFPE